VPSNKLLLGTLAALAALAAGCGGDEPGVIHRIDERAGSYRNVSFGDTAAEVRSVHGEPGEGSGFAPLDTEFGDVGGPPAVRVWPPGSVQQRSLRYDGFSFLVGSAGVYAIMVTERARTLRGVGIGDELRLARRRYRLGCGEGVAGERIGGGVETYPTCRGTIDGRIRIWFGEDPIRSIAIARVAR
jgi:hypothetical protein